jgi:hypothetical protein
MSEEDGYFSYLGLLPGNYMAGIDTAQMRKLNMKASPSFINFTIEHSIDGDLAEGLDFVLQKERQEEEQQEQKVPAEQKSEISKENTPATITKAKEISAPETKMYSVQLFALRNKLNIEENFSRLKANVPDVTVSETLDKDGLFKYSTGRFKSRYEAVKLLRIIKKLGWQDAFIISEISTETVSAGVNTNMPAQDTMLYKVQLLASAKQTNINSYFSKLIAVVPGLTIFETKGIDGLYRYCSESFSDLRKAVRLQSIVRKNGWTDCFVVIYKSNNP